MLGMLVGHAGDVENDAVVKYDILPDEKRDFRRLFIVLNKLFVLFLLLVSVFQSFRTYSISTQANLTTSITGKVWHRVKAKLGNVSYYTGSRP